MGIEPQETTAPPAEPIAVWDAMINGQEPPSKPRRRPWLLAGAVALVLIAAAVVATVLVTRPDKPKGMTQDLAVAYVQSEFPGRFPNADKLVLLFKSSCHVLDVGGNRTSAVLPMIEGGLSGEESSYILDMAIYSTCPRYAK